jgi:hypothetical protein
VIEFGGASRDRTDDLIVANDEVALLWNAARQSEKLAKSLLQSFS